MNASPTGLSLLDASEWIPTGFCPASLVRRCNKRFPHAKKREVMPRSFFLAASLTGLLWVSGCASVAMASEAPGASNIGFVLYTKSYAPGTLNARWIYTSKYKGPGIATGGPKEGFAGRYHVRYFYDSGEFSDEYDLIIEKIGDVYNASWITNGKVSAVGVGMEVGNDLAVGWRRVAD
jgi:hypothetical protein